MKIRTFILVGLAIGSVILNQAILSQKIDRMTNQIKANNANFMTAFTLSRMPVDQSKQYLTKTYGIDVTKVTVFNPEDKPTIELNVINPGMFSSKKIVLKDLPSHTSQALEVQEYATEKLKEMPKNADVSTYVNNLNKEMQNKFSVSIGCNPVIQVEKSKNGNKYTLLPNFQYPVYGGSDYVERIYLNID